MDGVQTAVVSTCISCKTGTWRHVVCVRVRVFVYMHVFVYVFALRCLAHFHGGVCYPCLLESDRRLCLIGVFTLSGLTHTDTLDLGSPPFAMKRENGDTETCLLLRREEKLCCYLVVFLSSCLPFFCSRCRLQDSSTVFSTFEEMNFSTTEARSKRQARMS